MRNYINIIEGNGFSVPDLQQFVTDSLADRILHTLQWVEHGDDIYSWFEEMQEDGNIPFEEDSLEDAIKNPDFKQWFLNYLKLRAKYIRETLIGHHGFSALTGETIIYRALRVSKQWVGALSQPSKGMLPLGIYWGVGEVHSWGAANVTQIDAPLDIICSTKLKDVTVNWEQTFLSRLDYHNGDEEQEIQLFAGSVIDTVTVENKKGMVIADPDRKFIA